MGVVRSGDGRLVTGEITFGLEKVADGSLGERYIIRVEGGGRFAETSKPLSEFDSRKVLHKTGHSAAVIEAMIRRAKAAQSK
jgi:hypothetical protein